MSPTPRWRPTARLFVLDPLDRLLLFRFLGRDGHVSWLTPGGGLHQGETVQAAAVRELAEETGYVVTEEDLGRHRGHARRPVADWQRPPRVRR